MHVKIWWWEGGCGGGWGGGGDSDGWRFGHFLTDREPPNPTVMENPTVPKFSRTIRLGESQHKILASKSAS